MTNEADDKKNYEENKLIIDYDNDYLKISFNNE